MDKAYWEKEIRENWFQYHKATLTKHGDLTVLDWKKPGTIIFGVRYVFDGRLLYVSGDIGEAVFKFSGNIGVDFSECGLDYFEGKLRASSRERRDFEKDEAIKELDDRVKNIVDEGYEPIPEDTIKELKDIIEDCTTVSEFQTKIHELDLNKFGDDWWEWLPELGSVFPGEIRAYLIGLQMANEQLCLLIR
jgi:hypothetical protein